MNYWYSYKYKILKYAKGKMYSNQHKDSLFFSYGHDSYEEQVKQIKSRLEKEGFKIFFDRDGLKAGKDWDITLEKAIIDYEKFILFITKHSTRRPDGFCLNEIAKANEYKKEIIPILLENESLPLSINRLQYIDFQNNNNLNANMENFIEVLIGDKNLDTQGMQAELLSSLNPINFTQDFNRHKNLIGREWVIKKIDDWWSEYPHSRILWITAEAGYGKSAISVYLANNHPDVIGVHFCSFNAIEKNDPINVIKTMAYNFQSQISGYSEKIKNINIDGKSLDILVDELILNPLEQITDNNKNYLFIIDALDEAKDKSGENFLANLVRDKLHELPPHIKIIITSRPEADLKQTLSQFNPLEFRADEQANNDDCRKLIKNKLSIIDIEMSEDVFINELLKQGQGNMLYINKFFEAIKNGLVDKPYNPNIFPSNLNGLYAEYFNRIFSDKPYEDEYSPIFEQLLIFEDDMHIELLSAILELSRVKLKRRLQTIGSFLKKEDNSFTITHKSIKDWLQDDDNYTFQVDLEDGEKQLEEFLRKITADTYVKHSSSNMFNYLLLKNCYKSDKKLNNYFDFLQNIDVWEDKINKVLQVDNFLIEKGEYKLSIILKKIIKKILDLQWDKERKIDIVQYYLQVVQSAIINNKKEQNDTLIDSFIKKIEKITSESIEEMSDILKENYSNTLLEWSNNLKEKSPEKYSNILTQSEKWNKSIVNKDIDKQLEFETKHLVTATSFNSLAMAIGMAAGPVGVLVAGGIFGANFLNNVFNKKNNDNDEKIKLYEKNLITIEKSLNKNPQKWIKDYSEFIFLVIPLYVEAKELNKAKDLFSRSLIIIAELNKNNPNRWQELYDKFQLVKSTIK